MQQENTVTTANNDSQISNPLKGAATFGLGGAALVAIGASLRENSVHKEAMTVLVGGVITGAIAGTFGCCLPNTKDASLRMKIAFGVLEFGISLTAQLTAPLMGEAILNLGTNWSDVAVDGLVGSSIIVAGFAGAGAVVAAAYGADNLAEYCCTFFPSANTTSNAAPLTAAKDEVIHPNSNRV